MSTNFEQTALGFTIQSGIEKYTFLIEEIQPVSLAPRRGLSELGIVRTTICKGVVN